MLNTLQLGRALAAFAVAAFHLSITMGAERYGGVSPFRDYTKYGDLGVDFFFVISGFIILFAHVKDIGSPHSWGRYVFRRFARLYPVYWLYTTVFVILLAMGFGSDAKLPEGVLAWVNTYSLIRFSPEAPPIGPAWTLFHEVCFYALFSLLLLNKKFGIAVLAVWSVICAALYHYPGLDNRNAYVVYTSAYGLYFLLGMGAFYLYKCKGYGFVETIAGFLILILWFWLLDTPAVLPKLVLPVSFALILSGVTKLEAKGLVSSPAALTYIGNASYSIYLTHIAAQGLLLKMLIKLHIAEVIGPNATFIVTLGATIGIGCLAYALCEKPLIYRIRKLEVRSKLLAV